MTVALLRRARFAALVSLASLGTAARSTAQQQARPVNRADLLVRSDIAYRTGADSSQSLDLYEPNPRPATAFPTIVFIHGGGLTSGDRRDLPHATICNNFVHAGMACASINYRLVSQATWPAQPQDVAAAIAWISENIASHGGDPKRIYLFGHSSGCHLAAVVATDTTYLAAHHLSPRNLAGVVAMGCLLHQVPPAISDSGELRRFFTSGKWIFPSLETFLDADPTLHVGPHVPPTLILVAESEQKQPPILENAQLFADRMRAAGRPVQIEILRDRMHMTELTMMADPLDPTFMRIVGFASGGGLR
jgi:acetyl esterase/lipase